jgi:hypothetical protein
VPRAGALSRAVLRYVSWRAKLPAGPCRDSSPSVFDRTSRLLAAAHRAEAGAAAGEGAGPRSKSALAAASALTRRLLPTAGVASTAATSSAAPSSPGAGCAARTLTNQVMLC